MCIIAAKPAGIDMPSMEMQKYMWENNPDGAGIMYAKDGKVRILKGFMEWEQYENAMKMLENALDLKNTSIVMHFRITTHGGTSPENCHPFPVTRSVEKMKKLVGKCKLGVAHNGIITSVSPRKGISDTMEYVATQLAPLYSALPNFYTNQAAIELVENAIESKMALLNHKGEIYLIGKFVEENGIKFSNDTYKKRSLYYWNSYYNNKWDDSSIYDAYGCKRVPQKLMWAECLPEGHYIGDYKNGKQDFDLTDVAIDAEGNAYLYDYEMDGFEPMYRKVYSACGATAKLIDKYASDEFVIEY